MYLGNGLHIAASRRRASSPSDPLIVHDAFDEASDTRLWAHTIAPVNSPAAVWSTTTSGEVSDNDDFTVIGGTGVVRMPAGPHYAWHETGVSNLDVEFILAWAGNEFEGGAVLRYIDPDSNVRLSIYQGLDPADSVAALIAFTEGSFPETIALVTLQTMTPIDHTWRVVCNGTNWTVYLDGGELFSGTSSRHLSATKVGLRGDESGAVAAVVRDWKVRGV